jgi:hypothetical protein
MKLFKNDLFDYFCFPIIARFLSELNLMILKSVKMPLVLI